MSEYSRAYSEGAFKTKLGSIAGLENLIQAARQVHALMRDRATPIWVKALCIAVLGYLILPTDAVADFIPVLGYGDDLAALTTAIGLIAANLPKKADAEE